MDPSARHPAKPRAAARPRLLACDIDGTLLDGLGVLRPEVVSAVAAIRRSGVHVMLATGRSPWSGVGDIAGRLGLSGPQVTMQGALVSDPLTGAVTRALHLTPEGYERALRFAVSHGLPPIVSLIDGHRAEQGHDRDAFGELPSDSATFRHLADLRELDDERPMRVFLPLDPGRFAAVRDDALAWAGATMSVVWSDDAGVEFLAPGVNKGTAVAWVAAHRGLTMADVAAVGDAANDRELLAMAGRSAAMGDAHPDVAACADLQVPSSNASGILDAFAWFFPDLADRLLDEPAA